MFIVRCFSNQTVLEIASQVNRLAQSHKHQICSRRIFENIVTKEEIAQNKQFLFLPQCFPLCLSAAELSYEGKG